MLVAALLPHVHVHCFQPIAHKVVPSHHPVPVATMQSVDESENDNGTDDISRRDVARAAVSVASCPPILSKYLQEGYC